MRFSPLLVSNSIIKPLRYFFSYYAGPDLKYDNDEKLGKIEIGSINDFHKVPVQEKPRILVNRGSYSIDKVGLTDNLAEGKTFGVTKGLRDHINMVFVSGMATVMIESRQEGALELITDMVTHFLVWTRPFLCNTQGFKSFAMPLGVSDPRVTKEDKEIFQVIVSVPYQIEEDWRVNSDALKLKQFFETVTIG